MRAKNATGFEREVDFMRRSAILLAVLALGAALLLGSCSSKNEPPRADPSDTLNKPFESTVSIRYKELEATAKIAKQAPGYCKINFTGPKALQDMAVEFTTDQVNISYKQMNAAFNPSSIAGSAVSKMLVSAIDTAAKEDGVRVEYKDSVLIVTGQMENGEFTLSIDPQNGNLMRLCVPADDFEAKFADFSFIAQ